MDPRAGGEEKNSQPLPGLESPPATELSRHPQGTNLSVSITTLIIFFC